MSDLFSKNATTLYAAVWERLKRREEQEGDALLIAKAMQEHPEFDPFWGAGEAAFHPQEINGFMVNPLVHIGLHTAIEKQLEEDEEVGVALKHLLAKGVARHDAIHQIAQIWGDLYFRSVRRGGPLDEGAYLYALAALSEAAP